MNVPFERKEKDKKEYIEYYYDDVHEAVFKKIIQRAYQHFRLFYSTFETNMTGDSLEEKLQSLRSRLDNFYTKYLLTLNLHNADIIDAIECLQYKPVTHLAFFRIVNFINMVTSIKNLKIKKCVFLYNQEVVYSSVNPVDLYTINEYLTDSLFPKFLQRRNNQNFDIDRSSGCFVTELGDETVLAAPRIFLQKDGSRGELEVYRLVIYTILDVSLVMLIEGKNLYCLFSIYIIIFGIIYFKCCRRWRDSRRVLQWNQIFDRPAAIIDIKGHFRQLPTFPTKRNCKAAHRRLVAGEIHLFQPQESTLPCMFFWQRFGNESSRREKNSAVHIGHELALWSLCKWGWWRQQCNDQ